MGNRLTKANYKVMPWKNSLGITTELAVARHDPARTDSPFLWRISIAGVTEDGPFSHFQNIERHILVLDGNGIVLDATDHGSFVMDEHLVVTRFSGDWDVCGKLIDGPIMDLNVMVDRRYVRADVEVLEVDRNAVAIDLKSSVTFFHVLEESSPVFIQENEKRILVNSGESFISTGGRGRVALERCENSDEASLVVKAAISFKEEGA